MNRIKFLLFSLFVYTSVQSFSYAEIKPLSGWKSVISIGDWVIGDNQINDDYVLFSVNESEQYLSVGCHVDWYSLVIIERYDNKLMNKKNRILNNVSVYVDDYPLTQFNGTTSYISSKMLLAFPHFLYKESSILNKELNNLYKSLYQQMLNAKESLVINTVDANDNKHSMSFSVKGLPEALMDFAERCGPEFQEFSGIKPNQKIEP